VPGSEDVDPEPVVAVAVEPSEPSEPTEPTDPTDPTEPTEPSPPADEQPSGNGHYERVEDASFDESLPHT
jgi:hypothetical protein